MSKSKTDAKGIIATIRALFSNEAVDTTQTQTGGQFAGVTASYNISNAAPVFVDISDDNIPDIDQGDNVYADASETTVYPDGTYTVDGTQFSFTVVAGVVTMVTDATGAGPGSPVQAAPQTQPVAQAAPPIVPQPAPPAPPIQPQQQPIMQPRFASALPASFASALPASFEAFKASFASDSPESVKLNPETTYIEMLAIVGKFATGTTEERISGLETMVKALMQYAYGYELQRIDQQVAINTYTTTIDTMQAAFQKQEKQLQQYKEAGEKLINLFEEFVAIPEAEPQTLNEKNRQLFGDKQAEKEKHLEEIADSIKGLRGRTKAKV